MSDIDPVILQELATGAARRAGELLLERFRTPARGLGSKTTPTDLVSDADRDAEALIVEVLRAERPYDRFIAEESGGRDEGSGIRWVIDPLDGTVNFLYGIPVWCVSIAAEDEDGAIIGVVYDPIQEETFTAARGAGALRDGEPIRVSDESELAEALIGTGFAYDPDARAAQATLLPHLIPEVRDIRRAGSAALDLAAVACGRLDGFYESVMERWDKAAGVLLVREAGGVVTELPAPAGGSPGVIAAGPALHDRLVALVGR